MAPLDGYLKDPKCSSWVKCGLALNITNEVLRPFVVKEITKLHQSIVKKLPSGVSCGGCRVNYVCPNYICDKIQCEIEIKHWHHTPSFTNTCTGRWSTEPWEIAKCYMPPSKGCKSSSAADADFSACINVIINCKHFQAFGTNNPRATPVTNLSKSRDFRNSVMHAPFRRVPDNYMKEHLDVLINVLNMVKTPETEADTEEAIHKIEQIKTNQLVLKLEDVIEVRKNATEAIADTTEKDSEQVQRERLLVNFEAGCRKALYRLTEEYISKQEENLSVADFLSSIRFLAVVKNLYQKHQEMLFPKYGSHADITEWDLFVYCFILEELDLHEAIGNAVFLFVQEVKKIRDKLLLDAKGVTQDDLSELCEYLIDTDLNTEITEIFNKDSPDVDFIRSNNILVSWWREEEDYGNEKVSKKQLNSHRHMLEEIDKRLAECKDVLEKMENRGEHVQLQDANAAGIGAECNVMVCGCDKKTETALQKDITSSNNDDIEKRESWDDFCRKLNVRDVNPEEGSIILNVTCSSITNVLDFWDSCIDGRAVEALSKVRDYYRRYFKCDTLEFDVILTKKGVSRCVNKIVEGLPSHFKELVDKVTHKGHEVLKTKDEDLITESVKNLTFGDEGWDDQASLAETPFLELPWLIDDKREEKEIKHEEQIGDQESSYEGLQSRNQKIYYSICDITTVQVDAIVCPTQADLCHIPYGLCTKVWQVGGTVLKQACRQKKTLQLGSSFMTNGYNLPAKNVIFTAGPTPDAPYDNSERLTILRSNYLSSLDIVRTNNEIRSVAFPCLGTGGGGLDKTDANRVAATAIRDWLDDETNRSSVDVILLCMFSDDQWSDYYEELLKAFPYGLDLQGNNLEDLKDVPKRFLELPTCSASTNNLCFEYDKAACKTLKKHFHRIVEMCINKLDKVVTLNRHFRNCAILLTKGTHDHQVIVFHSEATNMIEVQVTKFNDHIDTIRPDICAILKMCIRDYFVSNLENMTSFEEYLRCDQSWFGQPSGLWKYQVVATLSGRSQICDKHEHSKDYHTILSKDMLLYWNVPTLNIEACVPSPAAIREATENSISSSGSETTAETSTVKENLFVSTNRSVEEDEDSCTISPYLSARPSSCLSQNSADGSLPSSPDSLTRVKTYAGFPNVPVPTGCGNPSRENVKRKKTSLVDKLKGNKKAPSTINRPVVPDDSGNETESQFGSQTSLESSDIHTNTLCQNLAQKDLMKLARHMGSCQKRIGLCLELTEADLQNAMSKGEKDTELQAYYIIKKWMSNNHGSGKTCDVASLLQVYHECDVDVYQIKQELRML